MLVLCPTHACLCTVRFINRGQMESSSCVEPRYVMHKPPCILGMHGSLWHVDVRERLNLWERGLYLAPSHGNLVPFGHERCWIWPGFLLFFEPWLLHNQWSPDHVMHMDGRFLKPAFRIRAQMRQIRPCRAVRAGFVNMHVPVLGPILTATHSFGLCSTLDTQGWVE